MISLMFQQSVTQQRSGISTASACYVILRSRVWGTCQIVCFSFYVMLQGKIFLYTFHFVVVAQIKIGPHCKLVLNNYQSKNLKDYYTERN